MRWMGSILCAAAVVLAGCGRVEGQPPAGAAQTASRLIAASIAGDRVAFEAEIDRSALRDDLRRQIVELGQRQGVEVAGGPSDFALDRMIGPRAFRLVRAGTGEAVVVAPSPAELAKRLTNLGSKKACLAAPDATDRCLLTFAKIKDRWRLVGMEAMAPAIPV
jgi:hypothetical protein